MSDQSYAPTDDSLSGMRNRFESYTRGENAFARGQVRQTRRINDVPDRGPEAEMTEQLREQVLNAKLEAVEARMDGRVAAIEGKIDSLVGVLNERFKSMDDRMGRIESGSSDTQAAVSGLKTTMIVTAVGAVLSIVLGVAAFNATVLSNMVASFESGKNTSTAQAEVKKQVEETAKLLEKMQQQTGATSTKAPATAQSPAK